MTIGERLLKMRKDKNLSQEEIAERLNVTRQTISKWETDQSVPDFDKIVPICNLFGITSDELLTGKKKMEPVQVEVRKKSALALSIGIFLYFISIIWIIIGSTTFTLDEGLLVSVFLLICALATCIIVYHFSARPKTIRETTSESVVKNNYLIKRIISITSILFVLIYLSISFATMAWHITWILWIVYAIVVEVIRLIFDLRGEHYEE